MRSYFSELFSYAMTIVLNEAERVHMFIRAITFSVNSMCSKQPKRGFITVHCEQDKEAELIILEKFGEPKRARSYGQFFGASSGGRSLHRGSISFQLYGSVYEFMPITESKQSAALVV